MDKIRTSMAGALHNAHRLQYALVLWPSRRYKGHAQSVIRISQIWVPTVFIYVMVNLDCSITLNNLRRGEGGASLFYTNASTDREFSIRKAYNVYRSWVIQCFSLHSLVMLTFQESPITPLLSTPVNSTERKTKLIFLPKEKNWSLLHPTYSFEHAAWFPSPTYLPLTHTWFTFIMHFLFWNKNFELVFSI